jgi:hypothetical protein
MSQFDRALVEADVTALNDAFTYDPPEQWLAVYQRLEQVDAYLAVAQRAYRWVLLCGIVIFLAAAVASFLMAPGLAGRSGGPWFGLLVVMIIAPDGANHLARWLAERREPLLTLQDRIKANLAKLRDRAEAHNSAEHHVAA